MTLATVLDAYRADVAARCKARTVREVGYACRRILEEVGAGPTPAQWGPALTAALRARGSAPGTVNAHLRILRAAMRHSGVEGAVKLLRVTRTPKTVLPACDLDRALELAPPDVRLALLLAADAGLRHQEILHLMWADVDFAAGLLHVRAKGDWSPKSHQEREVPLSPRLRGALQIHEAPRPGWLFPGRGDGPRAGLHREVRAVMRRAGLYEGSRDGLHKLRRTFATRALRAGTIEDVRDLLGHADLATTQLYVTSTTESKRRLIEAMGD